MQVESSFYRFLLFPFIDRDSLQVRLRCCHFSKRFQWEPGELKMKTKKSSLLSEVGLTVLKKTPSDHGIILLCVCVCVCFFLSRRRRVRWSAAPAAAAAATSAPVPTAARRRWAPPPKRWNASRNVSTRLRWVFYVVFFVFPPFFYRVSLSCTTSPS